MKIGDFFARFSLKPDKASFKKTDRLLRGVKRLLVGIVAIKTAKFFGGLIKETAKSADMFAKLSKKIGIAIEDLQQWEFAAEISGTNIGQLRTGLQRFARTASDSTRGLKDAQDAFNEVGVKATNAKGDLRQLDDLLLEISDKFQTMPNGTQKTALAMRLFGRSGAELIPLLNEGSAGIGKLRKEFVELGGQISSENAKQFEQLNDDMLRVRVAFRGIRNDAVTTLLPALLKMVKGFQAWIKENRKLIKQSLEGIFTAMVIALKALGFVLVQVMKLFGLAIDNWELTVTVLASVVASLIAVKIHALLATIALRKAAFAAFIAWTKALLPFVLMATAILAMILIVEDLWRAFTGGESVFKDLAISAIKWLDKVTGGVISGLVNQIKLLRAGLALPDVEGGTIASQKQAQGRSAITGRLETDPFLRRATREIGRQELGVERFNVNPFDSPEATRFTPAIREIVIQERARELRARAGLGAAAPSQTNNFQIRSTEPVAVGQEVKKVLDRQHRAAAAQ